MEFVDQCPAIGTEDLYDVEQNYGIQFPSDLRAHYLRVNGGRPVPNAFPMNGEYYSIENFLAIKYGDPATSFEDTYETLVVDGILPREAIPFAYDASGDYFVCVVGNKRGQVWFYESDFFGDPGRAWTFLADNFTEFISGLVGIPGDSA